MLQNPTLTYQPAETILCQKIGDEAVLLDMLTSRYFGLTPVATRVWDLVSAGESVRSAADVIAREYHEPAATVLDDVAKFIQAATDRGLLTPRA